MDAKPVQLIPSSKPSRPNMFDLREIDGPPTTWEKDEVFYSLDEYACESVVGSGGLTKYNPTPGTGKTAFTDVAPNNYPFYNEGEKYVPVMQSDGAQLSDWKKLYDPNPDQEEQDRIKAYETGVPHGFVPKGDAYKGLSTIRLLIKSELHDETEYGEHKDPSTGLHYGGPCYIHICPEMRVEHVKLLIYDKCGIIPGIQRLMYAGKRMTDTQRTLAHYGVAYWNKKFPAWPLIITRF